MNYIKVKSKFRPGSREQISSISWLEVGVAYPIIDVYKYLEKNKETGVSIFRTWFLVGNQKTGVMAWVESHGVDFAGHDGKELNLKSNISKPIPEEFEDIVDVVVKQQQVVPKQEEKKPEEPPKPAGITFAL